MNCPKCTTTLSRLGDKWHCRICGRTWEARPTTADERHKLDPDRCVECGKEAPLNKSAVCEFCFVMSHSASFETWEPK